MKNTASKSKKDKKKDGSDDSSNSEDSDDDDDEDVIPLNSIQKVEPIDWLIDPPDSTIMVKRDKGAFLLLEYKKDEVNNLKMVCHVLKGRTDSFYSSLEAFNAFKLSVEKQKAYVAIICNFTDVTCEDYTNFIMQIRNYERSVKMDLTKIFVLKTAKTAHLITDKVLQYAEVQKKPIKHNILIDTIMNIQT